MRLNKLEFAEEGPCIMTGARLGSCMGTPVPWTNRMTDRHDCGHYLKVTSSPSSNSL